MLPLPSVTTINVDFNGGIQEHSSDERYVVFSVSSSDDITAMHIYLNKNNIGYKPVIGKFKNAYEASFIINVRDWEKVYQTNLLKDQEYVLYLWPHAYGYAEYGLTCRKASLYTLATGDMTDLGCLVAINAGDLDRYQDWTYDIRSDQYYVIKTKELKDGSYNPS